MLIYRKMRVLYQFIMFSIIKILRCFSGGVQKDTEAVYQGLRSLIEKS